MSEKEKRGKSQEWVRIKDDDGRPGKLAVDLIQIDFFHVHLQTLDLGQCGVDLGKFGRAGDLCARFSRHWRCEPTAAVESEAILLFVAVCSA